MPIDGAAFRSALSQFASGVTVVTSRDANGTPRGLTVSSFCSVSLDPPLVLVCIDHHSDVHLGLATGSFAVSILAEGQQAVSEAFAWGGDERWSHTRDGVVPGSVARLRCTVVSSHDEGDHRVYVGRIDEAEVDGGRPLVYHHGDYHPLGPR